MSKAVRLTTSGCANVPMTSAMNTVLLGASYAWTTRHWSAACARAMTGASGTSVGTSAKRPAFSQAALRFFETRPQSFTAFMCAHESTFAQNKPLRLMFSLVWWPRLTLIEMRLGFRDTGATHAMAAWFGDASGLRVLTTAVSVTKSESTAARATRSTGMARINGRFGDRAPRRRHEYEMSQGEEGMFQPDLPRAADAGARKIPPAENLIRDTIDETSWELLGGTRPSGKESHEESPAASDIRLNFSKIRPFTVLDSLSLLPSHGLAQPAEEGQAYDAKPIIPAAEEDLGGTALLLAEAIKEGNAQDAHDHLGTGINPLFSPRGPGTSPLDQVFGALLSEVRTREQADALRLCQAMAGEAAALIDSLYDSLDKMRFVRDTYWERLRFYDPHFLNLYQDPLLPKGEIRDLLDTDGGTIEHAVIEGRPFPPGSPCVRVPPGAAGAGPAGGVVTRAARKRALQMCFRRLKLRDLSSAAQVSSEFMEAATAHLGAMKRLDFTPYPYVLPTTVEETAKRAPNADCIDLRGCRYITATLVSRLASGKRGKVISVLFGGCPFIDWSIAGALETTRVGRSEVWRSGHALVAHLNALSLAMLPDNIKLRVLRLISNSIPKSRAQGLFDSSVGVETLEIDHTEPPQLCFHPELRDPFKTLLDYERLLSIQKVNGGNYIGGGTSDDLLRQKQILKDDFMPPKRQKIHILPHSPPSGGPLIPPFSAGGTPVASPLSAKGSPLLPHLGPDLSLPNRNLPGNFLSDRSLNFSSIKIISNIASDPDAEDVIDKSTVMASTALSAPPSPTRSSAHRSQAFTGIDEILVLILKRMSRLKHLRVLLPSRIAPYLPGSLREIHLEDTYKIGKVFKSCVNLRFLRIVGKHCALRNVTRAIRKHWVPLRALDAGSGEEAEHELHELHMYHAIASDADVEEFCAFNPGLRVFRLRGLVAALKQAVHFRPPSAKKAPALRSPPAMGMFSPTSPPSEPPNFSPSAHADLESNILQRFTMRTLALPRLRKLQLNNVHTPLAPNIKDIAMTMRSLTELIFSDVPFLSDGIVQMFLDAAPIRTLVIRSCVRVSMRSISSQYVRSLCLESLGSLSEVTVSNLVAFPMGFSSLAQLYLSELSISFLQLRSLTLRELTVRSSDALKEVQLLLPRLTRLQLDGLKALHIATVTRMPFLHTLYLRAPRLQIFGIMPIQPHIFACLSPISGEQNATTLDALRSLSLCGMRKLCAASIVHLFNAAPSLISLNATDSTFRPMLMQDFFAHSRQGLSTFPSLAGVRMLSLRNNNRVSSAHLEAFFDLQFDQSKEPLPTRKIIGPEFQQISSAGSPDTLKGVGSPGIFFENKLLKPSGSGLDRGLIALDLSSTRVQDDVVEKIIKIHGTQLQHFSVARCSLLRKKAISEILKYGKALRLLHLNDSPSTASALKSQLIDSKDAHKVTSFNCAKSGENGAPITDIHPFVESIFSTLPRLEMLSMSPRPPAERPAQIFRLVGAHVSPPLSSLLPSVPPATASQPVSGRNSPILPESDFPEAYPSFHASPIMNDVEQWDGRLMDAIDEPATPAQEGDRE
eukprot:gnl/Chilomastix_cuspidata/282.p1 GENE.gnl/Chilomastix_cuspidata/282~~gnl/Chilomastix_cuspidata/282.p1  ORF type:complete len:1558 (-),score=563.91 gnl/Chilomastix_cuspidata/282:2080-6753(-)